MSSTASQLNDIILRAGAGAGKTTTLTHFFLDYASAFKEKEKRFPRIVVTTFTRKATQELKERLLKLALEKDRQDLFDYITNKSQVQISTIHGVLTLFLGRHGHKMGLTSDFRILTSPQEQILRKKIIRRLIFANSQYETLLESYTFSQLEIVLQRYFEGSFLFKSFNRVSKDEFAQALDEKLRLLEQERVIVCRDILSETQQPSWVKYAEGLRRISLKIQDHDILPALDQIQGFFGENGRRPSFSSKNPAVSVDTNARLIALIDSLKDLVDSPEWTPAYWLKHDELNGHLEALARQYCEAVFVEKVQSGTLAMSDLEIFSLKLINDYPETSAHFASEWDYWMIDEYQDTSPVQVSLLKSLVGDKNSFIVGDPQQSIYLFRGARSEVFQEKMEEIKKTGGQAREKLVNYRSTPRLLFFINDYFAKMNVPFASMEVAPGREFGDVSIPVAEVRLVRAEELLTGLNNETLAALHRIQELMWAGVSAEKICVLSRTRGPLEDLAKAAEAYGVPVQIHVAGGFYRRPEVRDALALLKFLINPHDNLNFLSCLRSPWVHLDDQKILQYCHKGTKSFWSQALVGSGALEPRHPISLLKKYLGRANKNGYSFVLREMLVELGLFDFAEKMDPTGRREANLWKLIANLFEFERVSGQNFVEFLDGAMPAGTDSDSDESDAAPVISPRRVNLMTVHGSKGLQFDHVVILGMCKKPRLSQAELFSVDEGSGRWSLSLINDEDRKLQASVLAKAVRRSFNQRELEEHLRVLYVALTRAKEGITLLFSGRAEKNSWAESCPLRLDPGIHHQGQDFCYSVLEGSFGPEVMTAGNREATQDPGPWVQSAEEAHSHQTVAVTTLVDYHQSDSEAPKRQGVKNLQSALAKAYRGSEAHRIFESLKYSSVEETISQLDDDTMILAIEFMAKCQEIPLLSIIKNGFAEWGFSFKEGDLWIQGQIDLWGVVDNEVWIIDYKTGSMEYVDTAFEQLRAYAWSLVRMKFAKQGQPIHLAVIYPFEKKVKVERNHSVQP